MKHEEQTDILVVGAGPVGMLAALALTEAGRKVKIIDESPCTTSQSYGCVLHPRTLETLDDYALATELIRLGWGIDSLALHDGKSQVAAVKLSKFSTSFPFALVLPQSKLEQHLEARLKDRGVQIQWDHRLSSLMFGRETVVANIDTLTETSTGYIVPRWERIVDRSTQTTANFVVGADGHDSVVRQSAGIAMDAVGVPERFAFYEIETGSPLDNEARAVIGNASADEFWPMAVNKCWWTFQLPRDEGTDDYPAKERLAVTVTEGPSDDDSRHHFQKLIRERAPWFSATVKGIAWTGEARFERRVARRFGNSRCCLLGDAAHHTRPLGVQSLNAGMIEAVALKEKFADGAVSPKALESFTVNLREAWERSSNSRDELKRTDRLTPWMWEHRDRILSCLPATGDDLFKLAGQLGFGR